MRVCTFFSMYVCVQRSVHNSRTSAPREIDFCLLRSIGFIKRETKEVVRNMNRREMYPISVDKGKPDSSTLFRLCLLHWLPWAEVSPLILIFRRLCTGSKHWLKLFAINILFTFSFIRTDINIYKETSAQEPFLTFSLCLTLTHTHTQSSQKIHWHNGATAKFSCAVFSVNLKQSAIQDLNLNTNNWI